MPFTHKQPPRMPMFEKIASLAYRYRFQISLFFLVIGARAAVFSYAGSPLPYYDQWVFAVHNLFLFQPDSLKFTHWIQLPHNEHRLITTYLVDILGYKLNGYYDVKWLACISSITRAASAVLAFNILSGPSVRIRWTAFLLTAMAIAIPYSGYNALNGMQFSFYMVEFCLLASIAIVLRWPDKKGEPYWAYCTLLSFVFAVALTSFTSSVAIPLALLVVHLFSPRPRRYFWLAWGFSVFLAVCLIKLAPTPPGTQQNILEAVFINIPYSISWPMGSSVWGWIIIIAVIPSLAFHHWRKRHQLPVQIVALWGILAFCTLNAAFLGLKRGPAAGGLHMRHFEILLPIPICLLVLCTSVRLNHRRATRLLHSAIALFALFLTFCFIKATAHSTIYIKQAHANRDKAILYYRQLFIPERVDFIERNTSAYIERYGFAFFDDPILRYTPGHVLLRIFRSDSQARRIISPDILPNKPFSFLSTLVQMAITYGATIAIAVHLLLACAILWHPTPPPFGSVNREGPPRAPIR